MSGWVCLENGDFKLSRWSKLLPQASFGATETTKMTAKMYITRNIMTLNYTKYATHLRPLCVLHLADAANTRR